MIATHSATYEFLDLVRADLAAVETRLRESMPDQHEAITSASEHLLTSGGKRLRPVAALLTAHMLDGEPKRAIALAAAIEMLHTATLVHDDLIDGALLRRGLPTLNAQWSPAATVLTGDFLFARAAELAAQTDSVRVMGVFARTLMTIVNGEVSQLFQGRGLASRENYEQRIYAKTASLFATAAEAAALLSHVDERTIETMRQYGREIGMAFQIMDDILDFTSDETRLGKPVASDLRQGLFTLPVLLYIQRRPDDPDVAALLDGRYAETAIAERVVRAVRESGAAAAAADEARGYVRRAQAALTGQPDNPYRQALYELAGYAVSRSH